MRTLESILNTHLQQPVNTLAWCARLTRADGTILGFTTHDRPLTIEGTEYRASDSLMLSSLENTADSRQNNQDIKGILSDDRITAADIQHGRYDGARVDIFLVNWQQPPVTLTPATVVWLHSGTFGEIEMKGGQFTAELWGISKALERQAPELLSPTCRASRLGDARCKVPLAAHTHSRTIVTVLNNRTFTHSGAALADGYFQYGIVRWGSGQEQAIKSYQGGMIELVEAAVEGIAAGQSFTATRGCNRLFTTCRDVFSNAENFRGEPPHLLPGGDRVVTPI